MELNPKRGWQMEMRTKEVDIFTVLSQNPKCIQTHQGLCHGLTEVLKAKGYDVIVHDLRKKFHRPRYDLMHGFRFSQRELLIEALEKRMSGIIVAPTRWGKCVHSDTEVMMADGTTLPAKDIKVGDLVMGSKSEPRKVVGVASGTDVMYRIIPNKGDPWVCTQDHILVLQCTGGAKIGGFKKGDRVHVRLDEYLQWPKYRKHVFKQVQAQLEFEDLPVPWDAYIVGAFLGDGTCSKTLITLSKETKKEVCIAVENWASINKLEISYPPSCQTETSCGLSVITPGATGRSLPHESFSAWWGRLTQLGKHIPKEYLINSREKRLLLLAGLLDTDGSLASGKALEWTTAYEAMRDGFLYLCRSLGFRCNYSVKKVKLEGWDEPRHYYRFKVSGDLEVIPFKTSRFKDNLRQAEKSKRPNPLTTGFKVELLGQGDYAGIELEGLDQEFVLGNFTITHNSTLIKNTLRAFPNVCTVVTLPGADLVKQMYDDIKAALPDRDVRMLGGGSNARYPSEDITVCSMDSLHKCDFGRTELVLIDEPHAVVTDNRLDQITNFTKARILAYGATPEGRFDGRDKLITGVCGPVLAERTYTEAVAEGAICPLVVLFLKINVPWMEQGGNRNSTYNKFLFRSENVGNLVSKICHKLVPNDWQTLIFIKDEIQALLYKDCIGEEGTIVMAKRLTKKEREEKFRQMQSNEIKRCLATKIYAQGVTFSDVRVLINCEAGGDNTGAIQKPGRLAEIRPGKKCGIVVDLMFDAEGLNTSNLSNFGSEHSWTHMVRDSRARMKAYKRKGYDVREVENFDELAEQFKSLI